MSISRARFTSIYGGMTSVAKKVYDAVPIQESWPMSKVAGELQRKGISVDAKVMAGCLDGMRKSKVIVEQPTGYFKRQAIREIPEEQSPAEEIQVTPPKTIVKPQAVPKPQNPLDILSELSHRVGTMINDLNTLAHELSDAAVEIQTQFESRDENAKKLKQLQSLLKSIGEEAA